MDRQISESLREASGAPNRLEQITTVWAWVMKVREWWQRFRNV
ncbi:MAG: hypothetical protein ACO25T_09840 [Arenimonas sp.]